MNQAPKHLIKAMLLIPAAGLLMGNQSCQQQAKRELRRIVDMGEIQSPALQLAPGQNFDFKFVINQQAYGVMMESQGFAPRYNPPLTMGPDGARLTLSAKDSAMYGKLAGKGTDPMVNWSTEASCMVYKPQFKLRGAVNSFELVGGGGLSVGFSPAGPLAGSITGISAGAKVDFAQLDMSMRAEHPITGQPEAAVNVTSQQTKTSVNLTLSLGMFSLGPSAYYSTPLAAVTKSGLAKAIDGLKQQLNGVAGYEWYTRVLEPMDTHVVLIGGTRTNLRVGDQLAVHNEKFAWDGEPCASTYRGGLANDPVAIIEVTEVSDEISAAKLIKQTDENLVIGAKVKVHQRVEDGTAK